ncbi:alpha-hydroxy acid oxidase [Polyangium jinanense]|uniref:Alpha-hydroxy-acid oxidizing protein n=1 Tax=Polyangium jinanense TaxID=2829994 RepID=A0A9X4ATN1_9BACT|nr:alpha-hydroxy acid oxidase [Polyangium jinanense]MDC3955728.1 alpha-hydroxy-acid oxidizing protein [Polyangium jinanense]MDC3982370.1 alpha-hydroxy-acid oxidizing protein [Polyangium jinanense]
MHSSDDSGKTRLHAPPRDASSGLLTVRDFEKAARAALSAMAYDYYRSGADAERTLRENLRAYRRWQIHARVLVDVSRLTLETEILGAPVSMPILIAPTAYHKLAHPDGELATARAAARAGTIYTVSTLATTSLEDIARASEGPLWFQLYVHKDRELTRSLVERAEAAGYRAIVLTVDTPVLGRRLRDVRNGFGLPDGLVMANLVDTNVAAGASGSALHRYIASRHDASLSWRDLDWLRGITRLPLILKGIVRPDDTLLAIDAGAAGIIVSNHGARQLDGAPATLDVLPRVVEAASGRVPVLVDGGVRWGTDVLKALALGANAVMLGRPVLWGLATAGEAGVLGVLDILRDELATAMALSGCPSLAAIDRSLLEPRPR